MRKRILLLLLAWTLLAVSVRAQSLATGRVADAQGNPLPAAMVRVKGTDVYALTDAEGRFALKTAPGSVLEVSMMGMKTEEFVAGAETVFVLQEDNTLLEDVIVVGYGTQKRQSITGAVSKVDREELVKAPNQNFTNLLGGTVPGVIAYQKQGIPGADAATLMVRGASAKAIVDGVPRSISDIDPNDIESVSVLKDASAAAIYGLNSEAVIIVTTRRGDNKPSRINYHGTFNWSTNAVKMELLDAPGYAYWYNEALVLDGGSRIFNQQMVDKMRAGVDGWGNTDWYNEVFGTGFNQTHSVSASGGTDRINYYVSGSWYNQRGNVRNYGYNRLNFRANIDARVARNLSLNAGVAIRYSDQTRIGFGADYNDWLNIGRQALYALPFVPKEWEGYPTGTYYWNNGTVSPLGAIDQSGQQSFKGTAVQTNATLRYDVPFIKGLSLKAMASYDVNYSFNKLLNTPYQNMLAALPTAADVDNPDPKLTYLLLTDPRGATDASLTELFGSSSTLLTNLSAEYNLNRGYHELGVLLLMETNAYRYDDFSASGFGLDFYELAELSRITDKTRNSLSGKSSVQRTAGYLARLNYSYDNRYLVELSARYDGSYLFYGSKRNWSLFPGGSVGWRIDREPWFNAPAVDMLKLRAGAGLTGTSGISPYTYMTALQPLAATLVLDDKVVSSLMATNPGNPDLTWSKTFQTNIGVDLTLWNGLLRFEGDLFYKYQYDLLSAVLSAYPASWGGYAPTYTNENKAEQAGFEWLLAHRNRVGDFSYGLTLVGTYTRRRWLKYTEAMNTPDYLKLTGKEMGSLIGFEALGLFQTQEEIDSSPTIPGSLARPGDIRYKDLNGDGVITYEQDMAYVASNQFPKFEGGLNMDFAWKGLDLTLKWIFALGRTVSLQGVYEDTGYQSSTPYTRSFFNGGNSPVYVVENSWTPTHTDAEFPRLSAGSITNNNEYSSSFWYRNGDYLRLKNAQLGYTLPKKWTDKAGIGAVRFFLEGTNLLTFSALMKYNIDPEIPNVNAGYYPQQRLMGFGVDVQF